MPDNKTEVVFFQRKARNVGNYSVEFIFEDVRSRLTGYIDARINMSPYESSGLFKRLWNCLQAAMHQGAVNHVTGDVNYIGLFLNPRKTIHTILDCVFIASTSGIKQKVLKYFWLTVPVRRSKYITAISEATKSEILKYVDCSPEKIVVIPVAISTRFVPKQKPFNKQKPIVLQIGAAHNKNIPMLIEALRGTGYELHIVGKHQPAYEDLLKQYGIAYKYQWGLTDEEMIKKYEEADILSLVSTYEGFGMPILEAQAVGRPVITSNILSMPEVAGDAAVLVDPLDLQQIRKGIMRIVEDDAFREALVQKGFENIKRFDPQHIAMQYYDLYKKTAAR